MHAIGADVSEAAYDKTAWLAESGIDLSWLSRGCRRFFTATTEQSSTLAPSRPPAAITASNRNIARRHPRFGGHIERRVGTLMGAVHVLPDGTFSNMKPRGDYDAEGRSIFTLRAQGLAGYSDRRHNNIAIGVANVQQTLAPKRFILTATSPLADLA
ncbi:MAG: hypothetical protein WA397_04665 [Roseiarcus sp.]